MTLGQLNEDKKGMEWFSAMKEEMLTNDLRIENASRGQALIQSEGSSFNTMNNKERG
jgi:hypothetical protein